jgi:hypothetical protein
MIPITPQQEPADFNTVVRTPGLAFLRIKPRPTAQEFNTAAYWKLSLPQLRISYGDVCAYSSVWIPSEGTVDHFYPKSAYPRSAYDWKNYRLALSRVNNYKGNSVAILDPFLIQPGWFILDFATLWVRPDNSQSSQLQQRVQRSIDILKLNEDEDLVKLRFEVYQSYRDSKLLLSDLDMKYPFIAFEIRRQGIRTIADESDQTP